MAKIALISDVHLGTKQYGLADRYEDFMASFRRFGADVASRGVDMVVIGGDLFDTPRPDAGSVLVAQDVVRGIKSAGIEVCGIDGNHDLSNESWLEVIGAYNFGDAACDMFGKRILGVNYRNGRDLVAFLEEQVRMGENADILVAHFALAEMNGGGSADTGVQELSPLLDKLGVKAVLMGHVHIPDCRRWNGVLYVNPGSTEMKSSNEPKDKYYFVLDTETWEAEPVPLKTRKVEEVEICGEEDLSSFRSRLEEDARTAAGAERTFYQVIADDSVEDVFNRLTAAIHDFSALARVIVRSSKSRDLAPVVDRKESVATLESAIEARFPRESPEAKLTSSMLRSPEPSSIHVIVDKFMKETEE